MMDLETMQKRNIEALQKKIKELTKENEELKEKLDDKEADWLDS